MQELRVGDLVQMKKPHPCGSLRWRITRTGADIKSAAKAADAW